MSVRPLDMQVLLPHSTDVGKSQQNANQQSVTHQQQFAEQLQQTADRRQKQVQGSTKSEGQKVKRDDKESGQKHGKGESNRQDHKQHNTEEVTSTETMALDPVRGRRIDIKT